ncbi:MAG: glycoside hydrolase family 88 protein [Bacteroidota bacterium]|nr:glycoside hydrolase family 88 protein [Bacteroidota bacterium]
MRKLILLVFSILGILPVCGQQPISKVIDESLTFSAQQYKQMAESLIDQPGRLPKTLDKNGKLVTCKSSWWVSGFFPGTLWYLFENSKDTELKRMAETFTARVEDQQFTTDNHDVGFMIYCSFGNGFRITGNPKYKDVICNAAKSLSTRFRATTGCIRSWDWGKWQYPVIIDNMMNLEMMFEASKLCDNKRFLDIAVSHANTTMANHFRPDGSCFHVVSYDTITGKAVTHQTRQGYADASSWARGQGWALYGYTMCYRETKDSKYLAHAQKVACFILNHPRLPKDKIPYWDFDDPAIPNTLRDASAGALICSALIELSQYVDKKAGKKYLKVAEQQIRSLSSPVYRAKQGENGNFILMHSVGSKPENSEVDVPLTYADYYFVEALMRYKKLFGR